MKNTLVSLIIFVLLLTSCAISRKILVRKLNNFNKTIVTIENHINNSNWDKAQSLVIKTIEDFEVDSPFISFISSNEVVEDIEESLEYMYFYCNEHDEYSSLLFTNKTKISLDNALDDQKINIKNIF